MCHPPSMCEVIRGFVFALWYILKVKTSLSLRCVLGAIKTGTKKRVNEDICQRDQTISMMTWVLDRHFCFFLGYFFLHNTIRCHLCTFLWCEKGSYPLYFESTYFNHPPYFHTGGIFYPDVQHHFSILYNLNLPYFSVIVKNKTR